MFSHIWLTGSSKKPLPLQCLLQSEEIKGLEKKLWYSCLRRLYNEGAEDVRKFKFFASLVIYLKSVVTGHQYGIEKDTN